MTIPLQLPVLTTVQMNAIGNPIPGRIIYNSDIAEPFHYTDAGWVSMIDGLPA